MFRLKDLEKFQNITIQCHDNPDADSIGSGFALYCYFKEKGKEVSFIYSGFNKITKPNVKLMLEKLEIPIEYVDPCDRRKHELLLTVDCQYGAGNVTKFATENCAILDHHQQEIYDCTIAEINSSFGSCCSLVWTKLLEEGFPVNDNKILGTALYYGLYTDTNQFAELYYPLDKDMMDQLSVDKSLITMFRNSNLTLSELEVAGVALIRYIFNSDYGYAIIKAQPCDPNILGMISDFLLQVDKVAVCVVYNETSVGYKISLRSCVKEVRANELADFLTQDIGSGGGHSEKAGGFINKKSYETYYPTMHSEGYISNRLNEYFDHCEIIYAREHTISTEGMEPFRKKKIPLGYVKISEILEAGTPITIRTLEGDVDMTVESDIYVMIGIRGEVYPIHRETFEKRYAEFSPKYQLETDYMPTLKNRQTGTTIELVSYARECIATGESHIRARKLDRRVKIFTLWDEEKYMLGKPGDYLAITNDNPQDIYVIEDKIFQRTYEKG